MKKLVKIFNSILHFIANIISKIIVIPISKLILIINNKFDKPTKWFENWLSKTNTLLFISLVISILVFVVIDNEITSYSESSAEVLPSQQVKVLYDEDNYVVEGIPESVDITLIGNKLALYIAKQSPTNEVSIDLWSLKPGTHRVDIKYDQASNGIKYSVNPSVATVIIYEKESSTRTLSVDLLNQDNLDTKYIIDSVTATTDSAVIKGASYKIEQVATVKALVDVKSLPKFELGKKITVSSQLRAYDEEGNVVDVEISPAKVDVDILISSPKKEVPIKVITQGSVIYNMGISNLIINDNNDTNVTIYGPSDVINAIEYIPVTIDVTNLSETTDFTIQLEKPNGVKSMSLSNVNVKVNLSNDIANINVDDVGISKTNLAQNYGVTPIDIDSITVKVKGVREVVEAITADDITAYIDLQGLGVGIHEVEISVIGNDQRVEYLPSILKMKVRIYEK